MRILRIVCIVCSVLIAIPAVTLACLTGSWRYALLALGATFTFWLWSTDPWNILKP